MESEFILKIVLGIVAIAAGIGTVAKLLISGSADRSWRVPAIVAVLTGFALCMIPPSRQLKLGIDLAGGTRLIYEVQVPEGASTKDTIDQTILVLRDRVDPGGVRNLIWQQQGGNRIEIQMAAAPPQTKQLREAYAEQKDLLLAANLRLNDIDRAIRSGQTDVEGVIASQRKLLDLAAAKYKELEKARDPYRASEQLRREADNALAALPSDASEQQRTAAQIHILTVQKDLTVKTRGFLDARAAYNEAFTAVLETNIEPDDLESILQISNIPLNERAAAIHVKKLAEAGLPTMVGDKVVADVKNKISVSRRDVAIRHLIHRHSAKADQILAVAETYAAYEDVKSYLDDPNDLIALLRGAGVLEFRIGSAPQEVPDVQEYRDQLLKKGPRAGMDRHYRWFIIDDLTQFSESRDDRDAMQKDAEHYFNKRGLTGQEYAGDFYLLLANSPNNSLTAAQKDWKVTNATRQADQNGFAGIGFSLNVVGGQYMSELTGSHVGEQMAIVLDGRVMSAPQIQTRIGDRGIITGGQSGFNDIELNYMIRTLKAGAIQGNLIGPISQKTTGPQLGQDNLNNGLQAAIWALVVVAVFMAIYYMFWGIVADFALFANMVLILGMMAFLDATFTLPGIAGIVLTIGMAVDANVLIFERIREELDRQSELSTAVRLGYEKAFTTIVDANVTTLITCVVLGYTATAEIKGFAITLGIGIMATLFTALFCTRVIVTLYLSVTNARQLGMLSILVPAIRRRLTPNINWIGKRYAFFVISTVLIVSGLLVMNQRGEDMFDIEFRGGTQVGFDLADGKTLSLDNVRQRLTQAAKDSNIPELAGNGASVVTVGDSQTQGNLVYANSFSIRTLSQDASAVSQAIKTEFQDVLNLTRQIQFDGHDKSQLRDAPVHPIVSRILGDNINQPGYDVEVANDLGGVVILMDDLKSAVTTKQIEERINRMRFQPDFEDLSYRDCRVIGLDRGEVGETYRSVAIVSTDRKTNYVEDLEAFDDPLGLAQTEWNLVKQAMLRDTSLGSVSNFQSQVSKTMKQNAIVALTLSLLAVVIYIWFRFGSLRYGLAAIAALVHDVAVALGLVALCGLVYDSSIGHALGLSDFKINLAMVAALLTIVGYSLNDTIVVFDRIRENRGRLATVSRAIINQSINQTFSRTVLTSGTTLLALLTLYLFGGEGVHGFAFAMIVGIVIGTYSSIAIASPILLIGQTLAAKPSES